MARSIAMVALLVRDYDEAIAFFTTALRFALVEDTPLGGGKRWALKLNLSSLIDPNGPAEALKLKSSTVKLPGL